MMHRETNECKSLIVQLVLCCPDSFFSLSCLFSCYFYCYFGILFLFMFSSSSFTVDTSLHRSTSTGATFVIKRTRQFTSTPITTTPLHTQASIPSNTQSPIFSQSRKHSPTPVTTRSTVHASFPLRTQTRTHVTNTLTTQGRAHVFTSLITQLRTPT